MSDPWRFRFAPDVPRDARAATAEVLAAPATSQGPRVIALDLWPWV